jgi:hypothetical protein
LVEEKVEREYPYSFGAGATIFMAMMSICCCGLSLWAIYMALTDQGPVVIFKRFGLGGVHLQGWAATGFYVVVVAAALSWGIPCGRMAWNGMQSKQRIAFTRTGILLPRSRSTTKEEFVEYTDISEMCQETYRGNVTFLHFACSKGVFSIARQKLTHKDFKEICNHLEENVRQDGAP